MPGISQWPVPDVVPEARSAASLGIGAVLLFGIPASKDAAGSGSYEPDRVVQRALRQLKGAIPDLLVITDVGLCEYTDHGHWAMLDGMVAGVRTALDCACFANLPILSYSAKYASALYGPFRDAAQGAPKHGDRQSHQMDVANAREALHESALDVAEGADLLMVKPALPYLDVVRATRDRFPDQVLAAYNVSGEYAMVKAAAERGWIDERRAVLEILTGIHRAGADLIITYHAKDAARWLREA